MLPDDFFIHPVAFRVHHHCLDPFLSRGGGQDYRLFFSYEVLIGELRLEFNKLGLTTILALVIISVKGMF